MDALSGKRHTSTSARAMCALVLAFSLICVVPGIIHGLPHDLDESSEVTYEWFPGPSLLFARASHQTLVLPSGNILVVGGMTGTGPTATTEVFNPAIGQWAPGPTMKMPRVGHTATLLEDGRVLVTGGETGSGVTHATELVDLSLGASIPLPNMYFERSGHSAIRLANGDVLVTGGTNWVSGTLFQAEIYRHETHVFEPAGSMASPRLFFSMHALGDEKVIAVGGDSVGTSEIYDPSTNSWSGTAQMTTKRHAAGTATLPGTSVIASGGIAGNSVLSSTEVYSPAGNSWAAGPAMSDPRANHGLTVAGDKAFAVGSWSILGPLSSCESYREVDGSWGDEADMARARGMHGQVLLSNGSVMVAGGWNGVSYLRSVELLVPLESPTPEPPPCSQPKDIIPLVLQVAPELKGHSENGFVCKLILAQKEYEEGDIESCLEVMTAFYLALRGYMHHGHMSDPNVALLYGAYASVVLCLGGEPLPPLPYPWGRAVT